MSKFKYAALVLATLSLLSAQAHASEAQAQNLRAMQPPVAFTQMDINTVFEQAEKPMQLTRLSQQEMKETEGAYWPIFYYAPAATSFVLSVYQSSAYMPLYHSSVALQMLWAKIHNGGAGMW